MTSKLGKRTWINWSWIFWSPRVTLTLLKNSKWSLELNVSFLNILFSAPSRPKYYKLIDFFLEIKVAKYSSLPKYKITFFNYLITLRMLVRLVISTWYDTTNLPKHIALFSLSHSCFFIIDKHYYSLFGKKLRKIRKFLIFTNKLKFESDLIFIFRNGGSRLSNYDIF